MDQNVISLVNKKHRVFTVLGDHGGESALPTLWDSLPSIAVVGGQPNNFARRFELQNLIAGVGNKIISRTEGMEYLLRGEVYEGGAFEGWLEGDIEFTPTYKYYPNSDHYYGCLQSKKGEKKRAPAWCDRILWRGNGLKQVRYDRYELKFSDHRPVRAAYEVEVEGLKMNSLRSFFLSDRFDCLSSRSNLLSINEDNLSRSNRLSMREYFH